jgi:hypothetical protein
MPFISSRLILLSEYVEKIFFYFGGYEIKSHRDGRGWAELSRQCPISEFRFSKLILFLFHNGSFPRLLKPAGSNVPNAYETIPIPARFL